MARLTALMPVKAFHRPHLEQALDSVASQTAPGWRLAVVVEPADVEPMRTLLAGRLADPRIELIANAGRGLAGALNTGMHRATTDFAAILLADDMWAPDAVAVLSEHIERNPDVDFFHSSRRIIDDEGAPVSSVHRSPATVRPEDFAGGSPVKHLLCWRVSTGLAVGGMDESLNSVGPDDWDFPWTMAERGATFMAVDDCLYLYRDHRDCYRLTTHLPLSHHKREMRRIMSKHGVDRSRIRARIAEAERVYLGQCLYRTRLDKWLKERRHHDPRRGWRATYD